MGVGQVMGANHARCGYPTVQEMWVKSQTFEGQIQIMSRFIRASGLAAHLVNRNWAGFARGYNGPNFKVNSYDTKLAAAYSRLSGNNLTFPSLRQDTLRMGDPRSDQIRKLQSRLTELGYVVAIDGDFGPATEGAVKLFQVENELKIDGIVGPKTKAALEIAIPRKMLEERATATVSDLKEISPTISSGIAIKNWLATGGFTLGSIKALDELGVVESLQTITDYTTEAKAALEALKTSLQFITANWWIGAVLIGLFIFYHAHKLVKSKLEDYKAGKNV